MGLNSFSEMDCDFLSSTSCGCYWQKVPYLIKPIYSLEVTIVDQSVYYKILTSRIPMVHVTQALNFDKSSKNHTLIITALKLVVLIAVQQDLALSS